MSANHLISKKFDTKSLLELGRFLRPQESDEAKKKNAFHSLQKLLNAHLEDDVFLQPAGSYAKNTTINHRWDIDVICFLQVDESSFTIEDWIVQRGEIFAQLEKIEHSFEEIVFRGYPRAYRQQQGKIGLPLDVRFAKLCTFTFQGVLFDFLVAPKLSKGKLSQVVNNYRRSNPANPFNPALSPCFRDAIVKWVERKANSKIRDFIRVCKLWKHSFCKPMKKELPSFFIELLVIQVVERQTSKKIDSSTFRRFLEALRDFCSGTRSKIEWGGAHYAIPTKANRLCVDPVNYTNNIIWNVNGDTWNQYFYCCRKSLKMLNASIGGLFGIVAITFNKSCPLNEVMEDLNFRVFRFLPKRIQYQNAYGHGIFHCENCQKSKKKKAWTSKVGWMQVNCAKGRVNRKWKQKCKTCHFKKEVYFRKEQHRMCAETCFERCIKLMTHTKIHHSSPGAGLVDHKIELCEKCKWGKRSCISGGAVNIDEVIEDNMEADVEYKMLLEAFSKFHVKELDRMPHSAV